jgi:outer membrane protein assembly factor BamB
MNKTYLYNKIVSLVVIFLTLFLTLLIFTSLLISSQSVTNNEIDKGDGFLTIDEFEQGINIFNLTNCVIEGGNIILDSENFSGRFYNYRNTDRSESWAYYHKTLLFNPFINPKLLSLVEKEFDEIIDYNRIDGKGDGKLFPFIGNELNDLQYFSRIHHFSFKLDSTIARHASQINIYWRGKANNDSDVSLYCWQPIGNGLFSAVSETGLWLKTNTSISRGDYIEFSYDRAGDLFISNDNFIDVIVIANCQSGKKCNLFTDFVNITINSSSTIFPTDTIAYAESSFIPPNNIKISSWELFAWDDTRESIKYKIYFQNKTIKVDTLIPNEILTGNEIGFSSKTHNSPIFLREIPPDYKIKIKAELSTDNPMISPEILSLSIAWQPEENIWKDSFNSSKGLRIDSDINSIKKISNVSYSNGNVSIVPSSENDWPMFGQNPENTRSLDGPGPNNNNRYWFSYVGSGTGYKNPVIYDNILYIASSDSSNEESKIYSFDAFATGVNFNYQKRKFAQIDYLVDSSPAILNEDYLDSVIVATCTNGVKNKIYAFNKDDLTSQTWSNPYIYPESDTICYRSSPVIYDNKIFITTSGGANKLLILNKYGSLEREVDLPSPSISSPAIYNDKIIVGCENTNGKSLFVFDLNGNEIWSENIGPFGRASPVVYNNMIFSTVKDVTDFPMSNLAYTKIIAYDINGSYLWTFNITSNPLNLFIAYEYAACSTPTIFNDILYVASPDSKLYAIDINTGEKTNSWGQNPINLFEGITVISLEHCISSPAYAGGNIYVGSPEGIMYAINSSTGTKIWLEESYDLVTPILSSPVIIDGLIYYCDEVGILYCLGEPISIETVDGFVISIPINIPFHQQDLTWNKFYAEYEEIGGSISFSILDKFDRTIEDNIDDGYDIHEIAKDYDAIKLRADLNGNETNKIYLYNWNVTFKKVYQNETIFYKDSFIIEGSPPEICKINVSNKEVGLWNDSAGFRLKYYENSTLKQSNVFSAQCTGLNGSKSIETIIANISSINLSENISLHSIRFQIRNSTGHLSESVWLSFDVLDNEPPFFFNDSFTPKYGRIKTNTPTCTINVQDKASTDVNASGLNVSSAKYTLKYWEKNQTSQKTFIAPADCTGIDGTKEVETISVDISASNISENISELFSIKFFIKDMAGNSNEFLFEEFIKDNEKPFSWITNADDIDDPNNAPNIEIQANARDFPDNNNSSGIAFVTLYYKYSSLPNFSDISWKKWDNSNNPDLKSPWNWLFTAKRNEGGYYQLCTIAKDNVSNEEDFPNKDDEDNVSFLYDPNPPYPPLVNKEYNFEETENPPIFLIKFEDDFKLKTVEYRLNFHGINEWIKIADNINNKSYYEEWKLTKDDWDNISIGENYYLYFKLTDSLGNEYKTPNDNASLLTKGEIINEILLDITDLSELKLDNVFTITATIPNNSDIKNLTLFYNYSSDNLTWSNWLQFGENISSKPFIWNFTAKEGSGYYRFKLIVTYKSGEIFESSVEYIKLTLFPMVPLIFMIILLFFLVIVTLLALGVNPFRNIKKKM